MRALVALACLAAALFCAFGFAATFEPLERSAQLAWRVGYAAGGLLALAGLGWAALPRGRRGGDRRARRVESADDPNR